MLHRHRDERGAAAVEFALILPLLVMLVFGIIQFSLAYNRTQGLHAAAREGARLASLPSTTTTQITDRVGAALEGVGFEDGYDIEIISDGPSPTQPCDQNSGATVVVKVSAANTIAIPMVDSGPTVTLNGQGDFRCE